MQSVDSVSIYLLDSTCATEDNPDGMKLVMEIDGSEVEEVSDTLEGHYRVSFDLDPDKFVVGAYLDVWNIRFSENQSGTVTNQFAVLRELWYASEMPIVYDFSYGFRPNRVRQGEKRWLTVDVVPNVPRASDLERYYANLALASPMKIFIEKLCGDCVPKEKDLRLVVDRGDVDFRRDSEGYYFLDTEALDMSVGIYNVWFELEFGESKYLSDNLQLQVY